MHSLAIQREQRQDRVMFVQVFISALCHRRVLFVTVIYRGGRCYIQEAVLPQSRQHVSRAYLVYLIKYGMRKIDNVFAEYAESFRILQVSQIPFSAFLQFGGNDCLV